MRKIFNKCKDKGSTSDGGKGNSCAAKQLELKYCPKTRLTEILLKVLFKYFLLKRNKYKIMIGSMLLSGTQPTGLRLEPRQRQTIEKFLYGWNSLKKTTGYSEYHHCTDVRQPPRAKPTAKWLPKLQQKTTEKVALGNDRWQHGFPGNNYSRLIIHLAKN